MEIEEKEIIITRGKKKLIIRKSVPIIQLNKIDQYISQLHSKEEFALK